MACYVTDTLGERMNANLKILKNHHFLLAWNMFLKHGVRVCAEAYAQRLRHVTVMENSFFKYWMLNFSDGYPDIPVVSKGKGLNYGLDVAVEKGFSNSWFYLVNGSLLKAQFELPDGAVHPSVYDSRFSSACSVVKEFALQQGDIFQASRRYLFSGGFRYTPHDPVASAATGYYVPCSRRLTKVRRLHLSGLIYD